MVVSNDQLHEYRKMSVDALKGFCTDAMSHFACTRSVAERRHARLPQHIRSLYAQIAQTTNEDERRHLQKSVFISRKSVWSRANEKHCVSQVAKGKVFRKTRKLF